MNVARILYPVKVLGPGNRVGIWLCGCSRACKGCSNPELWEQRPEYEVSPIEVCKLIQKIVSSHTIDGFTISGGEPMDQASAILTSRRSALARLQKKNANGWLNVKTLPVSSLRMSLTRTIRFLKSILMSLKRCRIGL